VISISTRRGVPVGRAARAGVSCGPVRFVKYSLRIRPVGWCSGWPPDDPSPSVGPGRRPWCSFRMHRSGTPGSAFKLAGTGDTLWRVPAWLVRDPCAAEGAEAISGLLWGVWVWSAEKNGGKARRGREGKTIRACWAASVVLGRSPGFLARGARGQATDRIDRNIGGLMAYGPRRVGTNEMFE